MVRLVAFVATFVLASSLSLRAQEPVPSKDEVDKLVRDEPLTIDNWPVWRKRLNSWFGDKSRNTDAAYEMAGRFFLQEGHGQVEVPAQYVKDHLAWYFLGGGYLFGPDRKVPSPPDLDKAAQAYRKSIELDPKFGRAYRNLAMVQLAVSPDKGGELGLMTAERNLKEAGRLDPSLELDFLHGRLALMRKQPLEAERYFRAAMEKEPEQPGNAEGCLQAMLSNTGGRVRRNEAQAIADRYPKSGHVAALNGLFRAADNDPRGCVAEWDRAKALGVDADTMLPGDIVRQVRDMAKPSSLEQLLWIMLYFVGFYAVVMAAMFLGGVVLATRTRGAKALDLLENDENAAYLQHGQIARAQHESFLTRLYAFALFMGLILFYVAIPFVVAGLIAGTLLLLYLIFMAGRIPIKLVVIIVIVGGGAVWAVAKSLFAKPASGAFGLPKTREQCPRLFANLEQVAQRVDTQPVDEIYLDPGSAIGVHQEGRGPFGIFGVKKRVLTLGMSTLRLLTISELHSILAHEYAHFSHSDTFYSRFIYQVHISIATALNGMGATGGYFNYVNPFYWFLVLYYKCYSVLAAGYSRSREFLADRMASYLYGSDVFTSALTKVCTDGALFEATMFDHVHYLLREQKALINVYQTFTEYRDHENAKPTRDDIVAKLQTEKGSLFASHPTYNERLAAIAGLPQAASVDSNPAITLFDNPEETEKELTVFLTDYLAYIEALRAQAEAQAAAEG